MRVLHAGCGSETLGKFHPAFGDVEEVRLDIDPRVKPDIVGSLTDMGSVPDASMDGAYCSHCLEHLYPHDVVPALREFVRVLKPGGHVLFFVPDLEDARPTPDVLFVSPSGPISGLDLFYGYHRAIPDAPHMAHHCGFTQATLRSALESAGFGRVEVVRLPDYNLMGLAIKASPVPN